MKKIVMFYPYVNNEMRREVQATLKTRWIGQGPKVDKLEREWAKIFRVKYPVAVNSGTASLFLAYHLMGIRPGDQILAPVLTCTATTIPLLQMGAKIVFVDIKKDTLNPDPEDIKRKITKKTKCIVNVHLSGNKSDIGKMPVPVIGDSSQYHEPPMPYDRYTCYSLQAIKQITCFPKNTRIVIKRKGKNGSGSVPIKDLKIGDIVLTFNERNSKKQYKEITNKIERDYDGVFIKLKLSNFNEIEMTEDHLIFILNRGWIKAKDIKIGDKLLQYKYYGLVIRLFGMKSKGKKIEDILGEKRGREIREFHSSIMKGEKHFNYGKHWSKEIKEKISKGNVGKKMSKETKQKMLVSRVRYWSDNKNREKASIRGKKIYKNNPRIKRKISATLLKYYKNPKNREILSKKTKENMLKRSYWENYFKSVIRKKSDKEVVLEQIINNSFPNEFKYNGNFSLKVCLNGLIPDFVNVNGKKKIIELFGNYWHSEKIRGKSIKNQINEKKKRYKEVGFESLFILEDELRDVNRLKNKIENFIYNPNIEIVKVNKVKKYHYKGKVYNIETEDNHNYFAYGILVHNCGDGGMLVVNSQSDYKRAKALRWFGIDREAKRRAGWQVYKGREITTDITEAGWKLQMTDVAASLGIGALRSYRKIMDHHYKLKKIYDEGLKNISGLTIIGGAWSYPVLVEKREKFMKLLAKNGIESNIIQVRNDIVSIFGGKRLNLPNMNYVEDKYVYLPLHMRVSESDVGYIIDVIKKGW